MLKTILTIVLPFLVPFLCYALYVWFALRKQMRLESGARLSVWQTWPWAWLVIIGGLLTIGSLVVLVTMGDPLPPENHRWVPPQVIEGKVVPGHFEEVPEILEED